VAKLLTKLGAMHRSAAHQSKKQWLALVKECDFTRKELLKQSWSFSASSWSRVALPSADITLPTVTNNALPPSRQSKRKKENRVPALMPYLTKFLEDLSIPCPHSNQKTMPFSENMIFKLYTRATDKPCPISQTCFRRIWREHFKKKFQKPQHRDGLCQLCEIGHKIERLEQRENLTASERAKLCKQKNVVIRHKMLNEEKKKIFQTHLNEIQHQKAVLVMDFKENISLGGGPRELGQSWYSRERRTVFGMVLYTKDAQGNPIKHHFNIISECLTHDSIFVKMALLYLFSLPGWKTLNIKKLSIWADNAPHFRNKTLFYFFHHLVRTREFQQVYFSFFEPYHGKSEVDSMFGTMTTWLTEWKKTHFINSTEELLNCFHQNNLNPNNHFFTLSFSPDLWKANMTRIKLGPSKNVFSFLFDSSQPYSFSMLRLEYVTEIEGPNVGWTGLKCKTYQKAVETEKYSSKRTPKFSKELEAVNLAQLTSSDLKFLKKKANQWNIPI